MQQQNDLYIHDKSISSMKATKTLPQKYVFNTWSSNVAL